MAKKKVDNSRKSKVALSPDNAHPIQTLYKLLYMTGVIKSPDDALIPYHVGDTHLSIGIPSIKFGISFSGDRTDDLEADGWHIEHVSYPDIEPFSRVFFSVEAARVAELYSKADPNIKSTSHAEERLFSEIIRRGLPVPDRNLKFKRDDGTELTTPDFAWEEYKVSFFMDGAYWHSVKDDQQIIKEIKSSKKMRDDIVEKRKDKVRKDGAIRSELGSMGWIVLSCTDEDIEDSEGVHEVVDMIERTLRKAEASRQFRESVHMSTDDDDAITNLLAGTGTSAVTHSDDADSPVLDVESYDPSEGVSEASDSRLTASQHSDRVEVISGSPSPQMDDNAFIEDDTSSEDTRDVSAPHMDDEDKEEPQEESDVMIPESPTDEHDSGEETEPSDDGNSQTSSGDNILDLLRPQ